MELFTTQRSGANAVFAPQRYSASPTYPPEMQGTLELTGQGAYSFDVAWLPATSRDSVVLGYQVSVDSGPYLNIGQSSAYSVKWLAPGSQHLVAVRAYDAENMYSAPLSRTVVLSSAPLQTTQHVFVNGRIDTSVPIVLVGVFPRQNNQ